MITPFSSPSLLLLFISSIFNNFRLTYRPWSILASLIPGPAHLPQPFKLFFYSGSSSSKAPIFCSWNYLKLSSTA